MSEDVNNIPIGPDYPLWSLLHTEHSLILLESELREIMECVREIDKQTIKYIEPVKTPEEILKKNSGLSDADFTSDEFTMTAAECVISMLEYAMQGITTIGMGASITTGTIKGDFKPDL